MDCTCPEDGRMIDSTKRVYLLEPDAVTRQGNVVMKDQSKIHIFHADCPRHGYSVVSEEVDGNDA